MVTHLARWRVWQGSTLGRLMHLARWCTWQGDALDRLAHLTRWLAWQGDTLGSVMHLAGWRAWQGDTLGNVTHLARWRTWCTWLTPVFRRMKYWYSIVYYVVIVQCATCERWVVWVAQLWVPFTSLTDMFITFIDGAVHRASHYSPYIGYNMYI